MPLPSWLLGLGTAWHGTAQHAPSPNGYREEGWEQDELTAWSGVKHFSGCFKEKQAGGRVKRREQVHKQGKEAARPCLALGLQPA